MPLIIPANSITGGYEVDNSLRFNDGSSDYLNNTSVASVTNRLKFTISLWVKRSTLGAKSMIGTVGGDSSNFGAIWFDSSDRLNCTEGSGGGTLNFITNRLFRDVSAWYNIILAIDTTQSTESNRVKIYVNGVQETSFSTSTYPSQNSNMHLNRDGKTQYIGRHTDSSNNYYFDGYMAEVVWVDGQQLSNTDLGEFDEDSGIWKPIDVSGLTFGTNGFYLDFEDSAALGDDVSGNGNDFTVNNLTAIDQTTDTPTNNFATMNPLANKVTSVTFSEGNLKTDFANGRGGSSSTFGLTTGKWYVEKKITTMPQDERFHLGVVPFEIQAADDMINTDNQGIGISGYNAVIYADSGGGSAVLDNFFGNNTTRFDSWTGIIGMALDITNGTIAFSKDGAWVTGSGTTDTDFSNASKINISTPLARHDVWHVACGTGNSTGTSGVFSMNFGSPPYAISSGNTDANGYGNMEYEIPSGYYVLNSKNLAEFG